MQSRYIQSAGIALTLLYAGFIIWIYATQPRSLREVATNTQVASGTYEVDKMRFDAGLELFYRDQFPAAREEWERADPAKRDAKTQFYIAYSFYREGWGRTYDDDALFEKGLATVDRSISLAPAGGLEVQDPNLKMHTATELKSELQQGLERTLSDFNPLKVLRERK
jgi:hypothetical protein